MLFALIPIAWLAVVALCWTVCKTAQRGDVKSSPSVDRATPSTGDRLVIWQDLPELSARDARLTARGVRASGVR